MRIAASICLSFLFTATLHGQTPTPSPVSEVVIVVADRSGSAIGETPASVIVLSKREIDASAAPTLDETLRQSVGFSTFRRTGSRTSNPTTQGVSLRGTGSSGASRAAVLFDGVPVGDPFGGWVQWERVPTIAIEQIEVLRGGASSLYGEYALSGAVNIIPREPTENHAFSAEAFAGGQGTFSGSVFAGRSWRGFAFDAAAAAFQTIGFRPVDAAVRGPVDGFAGVRYTSFLGRLSHKFGKFGSMFVMPTIFGEVRTNGSGLQNNRTHIRQAAAGGQFSTGRAVNGEWRLYAGDQVYDQTFSAINPGRTTENLIRIQRVPARSVGASIVFSGVIGEHSPVFGVDARRVRGSTDEIATANGIAVSKIAAGGRETSFGVFIRDLVKLGSRLVLAGSIRADHWRNDRGAAATLTISTGQSAASAFADRGETAVSPHAAILFHANDRVSFYGSASSSFRSPTLNELYRTFRVGNVNTLANAGLRAERAVNFEAGVNYNLKTLSLRSSYFWTRVDRAVSNVTISVTPTLITRQRQNVGAARTTGFEIEAETAFRRLHLTAGYLFADPQIVEFAADPALVGLRVPQVARHQVTFQARYSLKKWTFAMQSRAAGKQFDDDLNQFRLEPFLQIDLFASRRIGKSASIFAALENVTNSRYSTGRTPIRTVSSPFNFRVGVRWN